jgi:serine protease AprX
MLLSNGWRWSVRFAAGVAAAVACTSPAYAAIDGVYDAYSDPNSVFNGAQTVMGADQYWRAGLTGKGVDVAVIDTGVSPVKGLDGTNKVIYGPDLSFDSQNDALRHRDANGHGTHMAGIIAGMDGTTAPRAREYERYLGVAPESRIVSVKVGEVHGAADVSQVVAAIDWVTKNKAANGMNIRVLNLSYGTDASQLYTSDPIAHAVEQAWRAGIFVVVAGGNSGYGSTQLNNPALNPFVMAVGATDSRGTKTVTDDTVPDWSSTGDANRPPDVVAPGRSTASLNVGGSVVDEDHPEAVLGNGRFVRGSGTSQAAAFVSGAAALVSQQRPYITPDGLKALLRDTAMKLPYAEDRAQGRGVVDLAKARLAYTPLSIQAHLPSTGLGSLEQARGGSHVIAYDETVNPETGEVTVTEHALEGEKDIFGQAWVGAIWAPKSATQTSWLGGAFNGVNWTGTSLLGNLWESVSWGEQSDWTGARWSGARWSDAEWQGARWSGARWSEANWAGARWSGEGWNGARWSGARWSGARWSGARWSGARWSGARWSSAGWGAVAPADPTPTIEEQVVPAPEYEVAAVGEEVPTDAPVEDTTEFDIEADEAAVRNAHYRQAEATVEPPTAAEVEEAIESGEVEVPGL